MFLLYELISGVSESSDASNDNKQPVNFSEQESERLSKSKNVETHFVFIVVLLVRERCERTHTLYKNIAGMKTWSLISSRDRQEMMNRESSIFQHSYCANIKYAHMNFLLAR